jgi:hypothetical protein
MTNPPDLAEMIDDTLLSAFSQGAGAKALTWLTNITLNRALPPTASDALLRHHEGQRALVAEIHERMKNARIRRERQSGPGFNGAD